MAPDTNEKAERLLANLFEIIRDFLPLIMIIAVMAALYHLDDVIRSRRASFPVTSQYDYASYYYKQLQRKPMKIVEGELGWDKAIFVISEREPFQVDKKTADEFIRHKASSVSAADSLYQENGKQVLILSLGNGLFGPMISYLDTEGRKPVQKGTAVVAVYNGNNGKTTYWKMSGKLYRSFKREEAVNEARLNNREMSHYEDPDKEEGFSIYFVLKGIVSPVEYDAYAELIRHITDAYTVLEYNDRGIIPELRKYDPPPERVPHNFRIVAVYAGEGHDSWGFLYRLEAKKIVVKENNLPAEGEWLLVTLGKKRQINYYLLEEKALIRD